MTQPVTETNTLRMGRPPTYTPEMDAIIRSTRSTDEINRLFVEMGVEPRSPGAIAQRRQYLKKHGEDVDFETLDVSRRLTILGNRRVLLRQEITDLEEELEAKRRALFTLNENMRAIAEEVSAQADEDGGSS